MPEQKQWWPLSPVFLLALAVPVSVSAGGIATGLALVLAAGVLLRQKNQATCPSPMVVRALGFLLACYFLSTLLAMPYPHRWDKLCEELWIKLLLVAIPLLAGSNPRELERALLMALGVGAVAGGYAVVQHFLGVDPIRDRSIFRPQFGHAAVSGFFSHHLSFAGQAMIFLCLGAAWLAGRRFDRWSWIGLAGLVVTLAALIWTFARSALLGFGVGMLVLALLHRGRQRWATLGGLAGAGLGLALLPGAGGHFLETFLLRRHFTRLNLWQSAWEGIKANPLLGYGPGNFEVMMAEHQVPGAYETLGHAHHDLLMHGVNAGLPGLAAALFLTGAVCLVLWRAQRVDSPSRWVFQGALAVQAAITVAGFFQVFQTDDEVEMLLYLVLGCALALARSINQGNASPETVF